MFFRKKDNGTKERLVTQILFWLSNCATLAIIILFACDFTNIVRDFKDLRLDNQLKSIDVTKFHEAVDSVISRTNNTILYGESAPNEYMLSAARKGYAPAQNYIGVYFHEQAKKINDNHYGYNSYAIRRWNATSCEFCQEELNRATYWWLKAALQNYGHAQENLGRLKMESLLTNQSYAFGDARYWLTEATKNDVISAYYYLGLLLRKHTITEAAKYWQLGAEKGDENCMRMLENPDFIDIETSTYISETNEPQI